MLGSPHECRLLNADHGGIFEKCFLVLGRVLLHTHAIARGVANDFVVHVGDIHDVAYRESALQLLLHRLRLVSTLPQEPAQEVDRDERAKVADVAVIVDGRSAGIHADFAIVQGMELLDSRGHSVVKL